MRTMEKKEISFKYIFEKDYNPQYVNGAFGGVGPQGEIIIHFYCERGAIPYQVNHEIDDDGHISTPISVEPDDLEKSFVRYIQSGVILDKDHAVNVYKWLGKVLGESNEK